MDKLKERTYIIAIGPSADGESLAAEVATCMLKAGAVQLWPGLWSLVTDGGRDAIARIDLGSARAKAGIYYQPMTPEGGLVMPAIGYEKFMLPGAMDRIRPFPGAPLPPEPPEPPPDPRAPRAGR